MVKKRNILITGGAGFIGSSLASYLAKDAQNDIVLVDNLITGNKDNLPISPNVLFIKADVNNFNEISTIILSQKFDYIFHYAAVVGVQRTLQNPIMVLNDIDGIRHILSLAKNTSVKRVFFSSSSEVYGEPVEIPQHEETTPLNSRLPYAVVKNVGESFIKSYNAEYSLNYTIFRFFNTYGPKQSNDFVISKFIKAALKNEEIPVYGDGLQTRTFCFIKDNMEVTSKILNEELALNDVLNIGNDREITILELAETIIRLTNSTTKVVHLPPLKEGDMRRRQPDNTKMKIILDRELITLEEGLTKTIESMRNKEYK